MTPADPKYPPGMTDIGEVRKVESMMVACPRFGTSLGVSNLGSARLRARRRLQHAAFVYSEEHRNTRDGEKEKGALSSRLVTQPWKAQSFSTLVPESQQG